MEEEIHVASSANSDQTIDRVPKRRRVFGCNQRQQERRNREQTNNGASLSDKFFQMLIRHKSIILNSDAMSDSRF